MAISIVFDFETGPLPDGELERVCPPFQPLSVSGADIIHKPFDKSAVKLGRIKDPGKIENTIERARLKYAADVEKMVEKVETARVAYWEKTRNKAALEALTGQVLAIGYLGPEGGLKGISGGAEQDILLKFWDIFGEQVDRGNKLVGFNIFGFDLPFLVRRSWILGLSFPFQIVRDGRYWNDVFIDLFEVWRLGVFGDTISLDSMAKSLGVGGKPEGIDGGDFARLWTEDRKTAREYLINDLQITRACAGKLGCLIEGEA